MKCSPSISNFLEGISSLPYSIEFLYLLHCSLKKAFLFLLAILFSGNLHSVGHIFPFYPLPLVSLLLSAICKVSSDNHYAILHFFFLGMILVTASCTMLQTSVHCSSDILSTRSNPSNLFATFTVNHKRLN